MPQTQPQNQPELSRLTDYHREQFKTVEIDWEGDEE
jgi:hypothetical protein